MSDQKNGSNGSNGAIQKFRDFVRQDAIVERFSEVMGERNARAYISSVVLAVANSPALQKCTPVSLMSAALQAASLRLSCDPQMRQAYLVPFKGRAVLIVGYKGLYDMAVRTGRYRYIHVHPLTGGQSVEFDPITGRPVLNGYGDAMEEVNGYLASFQMVDGYSKSIYMSRAEIHAHAEQYSAGYSRSDGAWQTHPEAMEKKTVLRQLLTKWGYLDPNDAAALDELNDREYMDPAEIEHGDVIDGTATESEGPEEPPFDPEKIQAEMGF